MKNETGQLPRDSDGRLSAYAWPGGYPLVYLCADGGDLCPECANGDNGSEATAEDASDPQWHVVDAYVHYEGPPVVCGHCETAIDSAYGDPDAEPDDEATHVVCPACGSEQEIGEALMGSLGQCQWCRCRYCGMDFSTS